MLLTSLTRVVRRRPLLKLTLLAGLVLLLSITARAQDQFEVFGGYSYMHVGDDPSLNTNGWEISGQYKFSDWLGGMVDIDGHYGTSQGSSRSTHTFLFGPQVSWPARVSPFAHLLIGGAHANWGGAGDTSFAMGVGVGIDSRVAPGIDWRMVQLDYIPTYFFGHTQNNTRVSTGLVFRF
jgi:Outer membrane protein beta-barrel domain